ncbi:hypothetical protein [Prevotella sp.]|jgi:hypothetical protein|uniref:hypothetical protein n=1 Tax=Prevotella sp. TaxID=59823 RepID=UPI00307BD33A
MEMSNTIDYYIRYEEYNKCIYLWNSTNTLNNVWIISENSIRCDDAKNMFSFGAQKVPEPLYTSINEMIWNFFEELGLKVQGVTIDDLQYDTSDSPIKVLEMNGSYRIFRVYNDRFAPLSEFDENGYYSYYAYESPCYGPDDVWKEGWEEFKANDFHYKEYTLPEYIEDEVLYHATSRIKKLYKLLLSIIDLLQW